ncbi:E3 ubiquitin-protein ligase TRIM35 [Paramormyrops kingsleyae]|uniref:E3 ubiquitin-protein ligase TRIM35 n=1 Tax=Paramormyrops kingsleyae TaxID=1676925 RepID=UPI003B96EE18
MEAETTVPPAAPEPLCPGCQAGDSALLPCGHRLCTNCLQQCQREVGAPGCTVCYGRQLLDGVLHRLLDSLFEGQPRREATTGGPRRLCARHGEELTLFCVDDEELVCTSCQENEHEEHQCCPLEEAVHDCKRELRVAVKPLQEKLEDFTAAKQSCEELAEHIKDQAQQSERLIKDEFKKLHRFLRDEEAAMLAALKEEEEQRSQTTKDKMEKLAGDLRSLTDDIQLVEEQLAADDITFLQNFKATIQRAQRPLQEPITDFGGLIDVPKHVGNLKYRVWEKMQDLVQYTPVTLNPNTADICLSVSDDLTSVRYLDEDQHLPDNPERFRSCECVLGSEAFDSGQHVWDVEVGDNSEWALGVARESIQRKEWFPPNPERGLWSIGLSAGEFRARAPITTPLVLKKKPQRVRVQLDWDRGRLTFSDAIDNTLLYKFKHKFAEKVFPYFSSSCKRHPLRILPEKVWVTVD